MAPRNRRGEAGRTGEPRPCPLCSGRSPAPPVSVLSRRFTRSAPQVPLYPGSSAGPSPVLALSPLFPRPASPQDQADNWLHSGLMRTAPGRYTGQGADSWMDGSPVQGTGRSRPERDWRQQEAGTEPLRGHGHWHQAPCCCTAFLDRASPRSSSLALSATSPQEPPLAQQYQVLTRKQRRVGRASGTVPDRNGRASTVGLCSKKGSTVPQQCDQALINQPALT